jgi:citrate synthase
MAGRSLISALVDALPQRRGGARASVPALELAGGERRLKSIAGRLWSRLSPRRPSAGELAVVNTALGLLADHELAASTLAARVAASTWADPYLVVQTGLGALGGPLHGAHSESARALLAEVSNGMPAAEAIGRRLQSETMVPGLGHAVYRNADPRAEALLGALERADPPADKWAAVQDVIAVAAERGLPFPNVDLAMAAACVCLDLAPGAGEAIFAVARCAGWLAHAIEEYQHRLRFRPRAVYIGAEPGDGPVFGV